MRSIRRRSRASFEVAKIGSLVAGDIRADIRDPSALKDALRRARPEIVFHLAAQSIVRLSYSIPVETFSVNVMGTAHVLDAIRQAPLGSRGGHRHERQVLRECRRRPILSGNRSDGRRRSLQREQGVRGACCRILPCERRRAWSRKAPISRLRPCAREMSSAAATGRRTGWCRIAFARLSQALPVKLRNPDAVRPWLHVLEPLAGYLAARGAPSWHRIQTAMQLHSISVPAADNDANVLQVAQTVAHLWGDDARVEIVGAANLPEAATLRLDSTKASQMLGWKPRWNLNETLERAVEWYKAWQQGRDLRQIMTRQLADFAAQQPNHERTLHLSSDAAGGSRCWSSASRSPTNVDIWNGCFAQTNSRQKEFNCRCSRRTAR